MIRIRVGIVVIGFNLTLSVVETSLSGSQTLTTVVQHQQLRNAWISARVSSS